MRSACPDEEVKYCGAILIRRNSDEETHAEKCSWVRVVQVAADAFFEIILILFMIHMGILQYFIWYVGMRSIFLLFVGMHGIFLSFCGILQNSNQLAKCAGLSKEFAEISK